MHLKPANHKIKKNKMKNESRVNIILKTYSIVNLGKHFWYGKKTDLSIRFSKDKSTEMVHSYQIKHWWPGLPEERNEKEYIAFKTNRRIKERNIFSRAWYRREMGWNQKKSLTLNASSFNHHVCLKYIYNKRFYLTMSLNK